MTDFGEQWIVGLWHHRRTNNVLLLSRMDVNMQPSDWKLLQGRCVFGGIPITPCLAEESSSLNTSVYSKNTRREARKSRNQCTDLCEVRNRAVIRFRVRPYCKNLGFSWPVHSSLASSAKLNIVKVDKTWISNKLGAIWLFNSNEPQLLASCSRPK